MPTKIVTHTYTYRNKTNTGHPYAFTAFYSVEKGRHWFLVLDDVSKGNAESLLYKVFSNSYENSLCIESELSTYRRYKELKSIFKPEIMIDAVALDRIRNYLVRGH